jgi:hypothetical protein
MSTPAETFKRAFGSAAPAAEPCELFPRGANRRLAGALFKEVGAGWFRNGFLYFFGEGLAQLSACCDAWSFIVPPNANRVIVGRNAYGALLVVDDACEPDDERVFVLDPFSVSYDQVPNTIFVSLIARALPEGELPRFLDDRAYRAWLEEHRIDRLEPHHALGVKVPMDLGGELVPSNLQLEDIVTYSHTTAPIYADAFAKLKKRP